MQDLEDHSLVQRALNADPESYVVLCQRYFPALVALAHAVLMDYHLAEDAAQEALALAYRNLARLKQPASFGPWVAAICRHVARDMLKVHLKHRHPAPIEQAADQGRQGDDRGELLKQVLERLSPALREVIFLRYYNSKSYEQMARVLGITEQAIDGRLRRAKKRMAAMMKDRGF